MTKAKQIPQADSKMTFEQRKNAIEKEVQIILDKYNARFDVHIMWSQKGAVPRLVLLDLEPQTDVKENPAS